MLHILLLILKIIGIIFAVILGILVLLVCIVVFVPVRYEVTAVCPGTFAELRGKGKVTWLLHLVRADIYYKENRLKWRLRIGWKKILGGADYGSEAYIKEEEQKDEEKDDETEKNAEVKESKESGLKALEEPCEAEKGCQKAAESVEEEKRCEAEKARAEWDEAEKAEKAQAEWYETGRYEDWDPETEWFRDDEAGAESDHEDQGLYEKIKGLFYRIKCTIRDIYAKIKEVLEKKNRILEFIKDESHVKAFAKLKKEVFKLLHRLRPRKLDAEVVFGFNDPSVTGKTLGALALFYPAYGRWVSLHPDFEKKVLKGKLYGKGRIRFIHFAVFAWNLLWSRHVRGTYKDIRNFEFNAEGD